MKSYARTVIVLLSAVVTLCCDTRTFAAGPIKDVADTNLRHFVTNVAQFRILSGADYLAGCDFHLTGVVTLVDTNRDLVVVQDATGAVAMNFQFGDQKLQVGQFVTLDGTNCCPYFPGFPDYPYRPSEWNIQTSFESPMDLNEYRLTRMRGYLRPPVTGEYSFWIASDNSSELWLSVNADPSKARKIAFISRFEWVLPREWSHFPSQHSEPILLKAGETYYIEALSEQTSGGEYLAAAWQGPGLDQSLIESPYLTPWGAMGDTTNGILRESWTNYSAGDLEGLSGPRAFASALTLEKVRVTLSGPGELPKPDRLALNQELRVEDNYRWVQADGLVKFTAVDGDVAFLELTDGEAVVQVRASHWSTEMSRRMRNVPIRVEGVCEGVYDQKGTLSPGLIWASAENGISFIETVVTNAVASAFEQPAQPIKTTTPAMQGFYAMRGVVTFNDRVFDKDYTFVQQDAAAVLVTLENRSLKSQLKVGQWVDLGGALEPGKYIPVITPLIVKEVGWHSMPLPIVEPLGSPFLGNREGRWSELEGVVHSVNSNGTVSIVGKDGSANLWIGQTPSNDLTNYVDAKLRARGVLLLTMLDAPVLLTPSRSFVDVEEAAPKNPFDTPRRSIAELFPEPVESSSPHRARVVGEVTYRDAQSFFVQDASGGIRVRTSDPTVKVGETVEVLAFPTLNGSARTLAESLVRPAKPVEGIRSKELDFSEALSSRQSGTLVHVSAMLLARKTNGINQVLELQKEQRVFVATLATSQGNLPDMTPGSRLRVTGVCDDETAASPLVGEKPLRAQFLTSLNIVLRSAEDVAVLSGPPWWTWKQTTTLVGTLLTILVVTLLWVHLLHRRLDRQHAAQLVFSRHVLERLEDERRRIAVNLHDSLGQTLLVIKNHAMFAIQSSPDEQGFRHRLDEISGATSQAIDEVRQITHGLRPSQLDRLGLSEAIRASVNRASKNSSILFASRVEDIDGLLDKDAEIHIYRIVQESVTNIVKHSAATEAAVVIKKRAAVVSLSIRDNGQGFDPAKRSSQTHDLGYGLSGIAERVRILGGTLAIASGPGEGTSLTIEIPLSIRKPDTTHDTTSINSDRG